MGMAWPEGSPNKKSGDKATLNNDDSSILELLEPQILETAVRLGIKLALFKISMFKDSVKFAEQLGLEPGDEVIIAYPQQEFANFRALAETLKMKGVIVHSFISMKIPSDSFAFGVKKKEW